MLNSDDLNENAEILQSFVTEGLELLEEAEPLLIEMEQISKESGEIDPEVVNTIFRLFHSLKGGAGFLDLNTISSVTHEAETLLDLFRKGNAELTGGHIDLLNRTGDFIRILFDNIENSGTDAGHEEEAENIIKDLKTQIEIIKNDTKEVESGTDDKSQNEDSDEVGANENSVNNDSNEVTNQDSSLAVSDQKSNNADDELQLIIDPEMKKQFVTDSTELLDSLEEVILEIEKDPLNKELLNTAFRSIHSFKGNSGFFGYRDLEKLSHHTESALDIMRTAKPSDFSEILSLMIDIIDILGETVVKVSENEDPKIPSLPGLVSLLEDASSNFEIDEPANTEDSNPKDQEEATKEENEVDSSSSNAKGSKPVIPKDTNGETGKKEKPSTKVSSQRQSIRVDIEKLDVLLDLIGELVIAEAMVAQNPDLKNAEISLDRFEKSVLHLDKITRDLQDVATSIRMVPLAGTFRKMIRLVRDISQKAGKQVDFKIIGEDTEVDKTVIEQITDPLVHIIRNSLDHGIETPEERKSCGKEQSGQLTLEAKYVGNEVWISIEDDGKGLDREKIIEKAIKQGLIDPENSNLPDEEVWQMIFHPGFSTAEKITDISGRGVGMDVVKRNIEKINGKVEVQCVPGRGTVVNLRIPLTLAIIDGMITRIGDINYIVPLLAIKETLQPDVNQITQTMDGQAYINIRGSLLPIIKLFELLDIEADYHDYNGGLLLVVENDANQVCLLVDELVGQQQVVIKGLSSYVSNIKYISGCTILGEGTVCLILDIANIFENAGINSAGSDQILHSAVA